MSAVLYANDVFATDHVYWYVCVRVVVDVATGDLPTTDEQEKQQQIRERTRRRRRISFVLVICCVRTHLHFLFEEIVETKVFLLSPSLPPLTTTCAIAICIFFWFFFCLLSFGR